MDWIFFQTPNPPRKIKFVVAFFFCLCFVFYFVFVLFLFFLFKVFLPKLEGPVFSTIFRLLGRRKNLFMPFPRALTRSKIQRGSSRI